MKVLIIDDEDDIREIATLSLGDVGGMDVIEAESGEQGLELARSAQPDLIVLDMMMPEMDGPEVLSRLRDSEVTRSIPIIFLTARASEADVSRLMSMGAIGVITKPFDPMSLATRVAQLYEKR